MEDLHYPIQYAILEIKEKGGYLVGYKDIIRGYIVSKCYVVGHVVTYEKSGNYGITHKVVFPFPSVTPYKCDHEEIPNACSTFEEAFTVSDLYSTYEEAKEIANLKNHHLELINFNFGAISQDEFKRNLEICMLFEQDILKKTSNMQISHVEDVYPKLYIKSHK